VAKVSGLLLRIKANASLHYMDARQHGESAEKIWQGFFWHLRLAFEEAFLKSIPTSNSQRSAGQCRRLSDEICKLSFEVDDLVTDEISLAKKLYCRDLGRNPFKSNLLRELEGDVSFTSKLPDELPDRLREQHAQITDLLKQIGREDVSTMPILFPTRPLGPEDLSVLIPNISNDINSLKKLLNTVRGTFYKTDPFQPPPKRRRHIRVGGGNWNQKPRIAVTSFLTEMQSWCAAAGRKPDRSLERFNRLINLCNAILKTPKNARPRYVLFPELSIPAKWTRTIAEYLLRSRISVILGEEYRHHGTKRKPLVDSTARLFLTDNRLGYASWCALQQLKGKAAHHEKTELRQRFGLELKPSDSALTFKIVYNHFGFRFGLLICSELTDMKYRLDFRGRIDSLFVLSWNQDLESFAALVDSAALDIHCFIALVNNRMFGDSRVRVPHKDSWLRDTVRVKGGLADYFVVAELDVQALRDFQSNVESPTEPFKPFPEGFQISKRRRVIPGARKNRKR
jgi:hypothetical protein